MRSTGKRKMEETRAKLAFRINVRRQLSSVAKISPTTNIENTLT
jgi:hypothetical protein